MWVEEAGESAFEVKGVDRASRTAYFIYLVLTFWVSLLAKALVLWCSKYEGGKRCKRVARRMLAIDRYIFFMIRWANTSILGIFQENSIPTIKLVKIIHFHNKNILSARRIENETCEITNLTGISSATRRILPKFYSSHPALPA